MMTNRLRILWDPHHHLVRIAGARLQCPTRWIEITTLSEDGDLYSHRKRCLTEEKRDAPRRSAPTARFP